MGGDCGPLRAARAAARGGVVRRPAGRRQDHHRRQAGALADRRRRSACCWSAPTSAVRPRCCSCSAWRSRSARISSRPTCRQSPAGSRASALDAARKGVYDVLIVDTAGRLHVDAELMDEVKQIERAVETHERLFVIDAMAGQDAVNSARAFGAALDLTGVILTKMDGDARGGAALSVREVTGKPIVLVGVGEKLDALEPFDAGAHGRPHPRHGRRRRAGRAGAEAGRRRAGAEAREEGRQGQGLRSRRPEERSSSSCRRWAAWRSLHGQAARRRP